MSIEAGSVVNMLCAGAAKAVVETLAAQFESQTGVKVAATFGAVGAMQERLFAGAACDVIILTAAQIAALATAGSVVAASVQPLGAVYTGVAVRTADPRPTVATAGQLRAALLGADAIYFPDPVKATAGIHFAKVLAQLNIADQVAARLMPYPAGAIAMRAMADSALPVVLGCTQVTEILYTSGAVLVARLPKEFELATVYSVALCTSAAGNEFAARFAAMLGAEESMTLRRDAGFEVAA